MKVRGDELVEEKQEGKSDGLRHGRGTKSLQQTGEFALVIMLDS